MLLICQADYWPALTPEVQLDLDLSLWPHLAIQCDEITKHRTEQAEKLARFSR